MALISLIHLGPAFDPMATVRGLLGAARDPPALVPLPPGSVGRVDRSGLIEWTGWDVRGGAEEAADVFVRSAPGGHAREERYELIAVAGRGFRPPRFLTAVAGLPDGEQGPPDTEGLRQTWSAVYRPVAETGPRRVVPFGIYLLGVNPPDGLTDEELETFDAFYTTVHMPEVTERRHALRAERYELVREVQAPFRGAPRFLARYEVDEEGASKRRHTGPPYATGPGVWQRHTTPWRLWYRRLVPPDSAP